MRFLVRAYSVFMEYMREQQTPLIRGLHLAVLMLVIVQIIDSNFIEITKSGEIGTGPGELYATWLHFGTGLLAAVLGPIFIVVAWRRRGWRYYFPWLAGDLAPLKQDVDQLKRLQLPEPTDGGLAAIVQGMGLGALALVLMSGVTWFIAWNLGLPWSHDVKEIHELVTGLVEAYLIGHGGMGLLHIYLGPWLRARNARV